jgi:hypothetical protein
MKSDDTLIVARLVAQLSIALKWQIIGREKGCRKPGDTVGELIAVDFY